ncbi:MAG: glycosyl hydrolase 115 family protein [Bacteroidaceae bacterium]|nr:glycosyl hydrolase 115 family protein [Bacteroidaceae bacterium]
MRHILLLIGCCFALMAQARKFEIQQGETAYICMEKTDKQVASTALDILRSDFRKVLRAELQEVPSGEDAHIIARISNSLGREAFSIEVNRKGQMVIEGGDAHGLAYGFLEVSRLMGVSPWEWWADATPRQLTCFTLKSKYRTRQEPSVDYRGIFINDEDWGLMPWANNYEGLGRGKIGPKVNARIFELLLRLRANYYWPAMHECTHPFFLTEGNREMAAKYGIYVGGSHCEPMASSTAVEWGLRGKGDYDYVNNSDNVKEFWEERVRDVKDQEIVYTLGMRGVHDGKMQGAKTIEEQKAVLKRVINDQRMMLSKHINGDLTQIPQVFIPYKEVLDIYNAGLEVPEDITLMWCDDNYGYIRHFPTEAERQRKGGNGDYYHVSYWGRPHDYLWLCTFSPNLLHQQMSMAYERGIQKMWILNVGDIKPAEYQIELFMDMAWNIDEVNRKGVEQHMSDFYAREFGKNHARAITEIMKEHYRLASIRRPEFMAGTRTEESDRKYWGTQRELPWSDGYKAQRIGDYRNISDKAEKIYKSIALDRRDTYFQLVKYPVQGATQMNYKYLCPLNESAEAYDSIASLTRTYNQGISNFGKWNGIMDMHPRRLSVFSPVTSPLAPSHEKEITENESDMALNMQTKGECHTTTFSTPLTSTPSSLTFEVRLLPSHPVEGNKLSFQLTLDGTDSKEIEYQTYGRSEEWKQNILRGYAVRKITLPTNGKKKHKLTFTPLTPGVILQEIRLIGN